MIGTLFTHWLEADGEVIVRSRFRLDHHVRPTPQRLSGSGPSAAYGTLRRPWSCRDRRALQRCPHRRCQQKDHFWNIVSTCLEHCWTIFGPRSDHCWNICGSCLEQFWTVWISVGTSVDQVWISWGTALGQVWNIYGRSLHYVWNSFGPGLDHFGNIS